MTAGAREKAPPSHRYALRLPMVLRPALIAAALVAPGVVPRRGQAIIASPHPFAVRQPDGQSVALHIRGDEHLHWLEDERGYTVVRGCGGAYVYGGLDASGRLVATALVVGRADPAAAGLPRRLLAAPAQRTYSDLGVLAPETIAPGAPKATAAVGTVKNLVVLMRFSDHLTRPVPTQATVDTIFNAVGGDPIAAPTGSVQDYYREVSYGLMTLASTVTVWVDLPDTEAHYAAGASGLSTVVWDAIRDALNGADPSVDFSQFDQDGDGFVDAIAFLHSGYGAEWGGVDAYGTDETNRIWSHKWQIPTWTSAEGVRVSSYYISPALWGVSGSSPGHIGVIAHEAGHFFGLPDLYDTDYTGEGIGSYCLMANSWGFSGDQLNPPHMSAWAKASLGWVSPTLLTAPGMYAAPQAETNPTVFRIDHDYPSGEYLLVENRQPVGFESTMPQGGLAIWHVDEAKGDNTDEGYPGQAGWPSNNRHYRIALLQADGNYDLEHGFGRGDGGDVYQGNGASTISPTSTPNTDAYQNGIVTSTGNRISSVSAAGPTMTFQYGIDTCGDGFLDPGEECDDDNTQDGDCCSSVCELEASGSPCPADDTICTIDVCDGAGACEHLGSPLGGCRSAVRSLLMLKNNSTDDGKDKLLWKWIKGDAVDRTELADPQSSASYALCVFAGTANALIADATLPPGPGWSAVGSKGYKFKGLSPDGLSLAVLKGGAAGKSKAVVKGKGPALPDPVLPVTYPVTVQLRKGGSPLCLESIFTGVDEQENSAAQFKAKH